jgi:LacI family transcriptional regulator
MKKTVSIREVAKLAGVSTATVSNVYSGKKRVNEDLARRVREAGDELGYRVHRIASQLRSGKNNIVGVLVPDLSDPFFTSIVTELENLAQTSGYEIIVANSNDNPQTEEGRLNTLLSSRPAGLVVIPCTDSIPSQLLEEENIPPFVLADRVSDMNVTDTVVIDNHEAGATAAEHLVKLGHRKLLVAASDLRFQPVRERYRGAKEVFLNSGGVAAVIEVGSKPFEGAAILKDWLNKNDQPTAILATTGKTTLAVLAVTADLKLDIPEQISLVGFDDYPWMSVRKVPLTAINQPVPDISRSVWECLNARMAGEEFARKKIVLSCTLEVRDSTRAVKSL